MNAARINKSALVVLGLGIVGRPDSWGATQTLVQAATITRGEGLVVLTVIGAIAGLAVLLYNCRRRAAARLVRTRALREFSTQLIHSQEQERKRLAHELHDGLGQDLLLMKTSAQLAMREAGAPAAVTGRLEQIAALASEAVQEIRSITSDLRPPELDRLGLGSAIEAMADRVSENSSLEVGCEVDCLNRQLPQHSAINLYRIIQECLTNTVKHSGAYRVDIRAERVNGDLRISVADDGRGFESMEPERPDGRTPLGLVGLVERTRGLGGQLTIRSSKGKGARILLTIPLDENECA